MTWLIRSTPRGMRRAAYVAVTLAFASAAMSLFWTLGGTWLLDTVGGSIETLARSRSIGALLLGAAATLGKALAGLLALGLVRPWGLRVGARLLSTVNWVVSVILMVWGGANVCVGALVLTGVFSPISEPDKRARCGTCLCGIAGSLRGALPWAWTRGLPAHGGPVRR